MPFRYRCLCRYQTEIRGIGMRRTVKDRRRLIEIPIASMALHVTRGMERWLSFFPKSENGALCAMKEVELFPDDPKSAECIKQLNQEIKLLTNLQHPNIRVYDRFFIYLEYVHPGSINKYIQDHCGGTMTESVVRNFTRHILSGLAYLHSKKTVHRDIKGANLLVDTSGVVKLADFGMAKHLTRQRADLSLKGSPYWMAPEVVFSYASRDAKR
ncbi:hypothetical protein Bca4012_033065 [Brassica carinata]